MIPRIFVTSDTHFGHRNILNFEPRPWKDIMEMDEGLINRWNSVVGVNDIVIHVGDVFLCGAKRAEYIASRLNGRKILIMGNHDSFSKKKYRELGFDVRDYLYLDDFLFSHYPQHIPALRQAQISSDFKANIHGHVHSQIDSLDPGVHICVCTELTDYTPIEFELIKDSFEKGICLWKQEI